MVVIVRSGLQQEGYLVGLLFEEADRTPMEGPDSKEEALNIERQELEVVVIASQAFQFDEVAASFKAEAYLEAS